jgi:hypothetical protein
MLKLTQLNDWFSSGPFGFEYDSQGTTHLVDYHFQYDPGTLPVYQVPEINCELSLGFTSNRTGVGHSVTLSHDVYLLVNPIEEKPLSELITIAHDLELLITLMTGFTSPIYSLALIPPATSERKQEQLYLYSHTLRQFGMKLFHRGDMPANYEFVQPAFTEILNSWFALAHKFAPVIRLLRATLFTPNSPYIENRFLAVAQALEAYCRIAAKETHVPRCEFTKIKKAMRSQIPSNVADDFQELLKHRIGAMNEYSFRDRLLSLFRRHTWLKFILARDKDHVPTDTEVTSFAKQFVEARNSLTHVDAGKDSRGLVDYRMFALGRDILCLMFLREAGIPAEENYIRIHKEWGSVMWWRDEVFV